MTKEVYTEDWLEDGKRHILLNCPHCDHNTVYSSDPDYKPQEADGLFQNRFASVVEID